MPNPASHDLSSPTADLARAEAVDRLSDGFSHDTRNPLNAMVIHLEVLADKLRRENGGAIPANLERNFKAIRDQVGRIDDMIRRFVELAAPHRQHEPGFDLGALARSVVEQCTHPARLARAELRFEGAAGLDVSGSASAFGVALALYLTSELDAGCKRLAVRVAVRDASAALEIDGASTVLTPALAQLRRAAEAMAGELIVGGGRVVLTVPHARDPGLRVVDPSAPVVE